MTKDDRDKFQSMESNVHRILHLLEGDESFHLPGLAQKVNDIDGKLNGLIEREKIYRAKATVFGVVGGFLVSVIAYLGKFLFDN